MAGEDRADRVAGRRPACRATSSRSVSASTATAWTSLPPARRSFAAPMARSTLGDVHRVRLLLAFEAAGVPLEALLDASRVGAISLRYYDQLHPAPGPLSGQDLRGLHALGHAGVRPSAAAVRSARPRRTGHRRPPDPGRRGVPDRHAWPSSSRPATRISPFGHSGSSATAHVGRRMGRWPPMARPSTGRTSTYAGFPSTSCTSASSGRGRGSPGSPGGSPRGWLRVI